MSKPANKTLIGIFVLGAIALAGVTVVVLGSGKFFKKNLLAVCYFEGSVGGLNVGAPVVFRGVKVGTVAHVKLRIDPKSEEIQIPVFLEIEPDRIEKKEGSRKHDPKATLKLFIDRGLRAQIESQSILTGQMQVDLEFLPQRPAKFVRADPDYTEIPTAPTPWQELTRRIEQLPIQQILKDIGSAVDGIDRFVRSPEITQSLRSVSATTEETRNLIRKLDAKMDPLILNVEAAVKDAQKLLQDIDRQVEPARMDPLILQIETAVKDAQKLLEGLDRNVETLGPSIQKASDGMEKTLKSADSALSSAQRAIEGVEERVGEDSPLAYRLNRAIEEVSNLAGSVRRLADYLERHPRAVLRGKR